MKKYQIAYFGTPYFSADFLEKMLLDKELPIEVKLVVTQPDRPVGKKQTLTSSPVKTLAEKYHVTVVDKIEKLEGIDFAIINAYGNIVPKTVLTSTKLHFMHDSGFLNIHWSLLPKFRGAAPLAYALLLGQKKTGISLFIMDEQLDHGPIVIQEEIDIPDHAKRPELEKTLTVVAFKLLKNTVNNLTTSPMQLQEQSHNLATTSPQLKKEDGFVSFSTLQKAVRNEPLIKEELPLIIHTYLSKYPHEKENFFKITINFSLLIFNLFRGLYPWPGIWTRIEPSRLDNPVNDRTSKVNIIGKRLKIIDLDYTNNRLMIKKVQLEGKKEVDFNTFQAAYRIF